MASTSSALVLVLLLKWEIGPVCQELDSMIGLDPYQEGRGHICQYQRLVRWQRPESRLA